MSSSYKPKSRLKLLGELIAVTICGYLVLIITTSADICSYNYMNYRDYWGYIIHVEIIPVVIVVLVIIVSYTLYDIFTRY